MHELMHEHVQQHARSRLAASGRVLDQPSDHDPVRREQQMLFLTIHIAHVESAHARVEQRHGESAGRWGVQMDRAATLWSWSRRVAVAEAVDLAAMTSEMMVATAPAAMEVVASGRRWCASGGGRWRRLRRCP